MIRVQFGRFGKFSTDIETRDPPIEVLRAIVLWLEGIKHDLLVSYRLLEEAGYITYGEGWLKHKL